MQSFIIRRRSGWGCMADLEKAGAVSREVADQQMPDKVRWIRTYAVKEEDGRVGTVCVYEATDAEALRDHARRAGLPADEITLVSATLVIRPDPAAAGA